MKLRHTAALVGWYLMMPPFEHPNVPLSQWRIVGSYDFAGYCERERDKALAESTKHDATHETVVHVQGSSIPYDPSLATCVSSDDPRLSK